MIFFKDIPEKNHKGVREEIAEGISEETPKEIPVGTLN